MRKRLAQSLASFIPFLSHNSLGSQSSLEIANRLEMSQKQHELYEKPATIEGVPNENTNLEVAALQLEAVMDLPLVSTRAGLYIFLNSLVSLTVAQAGQVLTALQLVARPLTDEFTIINYLHSRYKVLRLHDYCDMLLTFNRSTPRTWPQT
jgi:mediator of RNA polymerase II transcription subunit 5